MKKKIIFDAYRLGAENTGLFHFTKSLGSALNEALYDDPDWEITFFAEKKHSDKIDSEAAIMPIRPYHRYSLRAPKNTAVWHSVYQLATHVPRGKHHQNLLTVHDLNFLYQKDARKQKKYLDWIMRDIDRADHIVTISQFAKSDLLEHLNVGGKPVDVIYNGCNIYDGPITPPKRIPTRSFLFGIGVIQSKKNWHVLPSLLKGNDFELILAGNLSSYTEEILREAKRWGVTERVHLLGSIPESEKHWYLSNCKAFVFPSKAEGFGLPVLEALYYGKPVFLSRHTSLPEIGGEYAYYFNYDFEPELMQREFMQGLEEYDKESNHDTKQAYALSFSWERAAAEYIKIYKKLAQQQ